MKSNIEKGIKDYALTKVESKSYALVDTFLTYIAVFCSPIIKLINLLLIDYFGHSNYIIPVEVEYILSVLVSIYFMTDLTLNFFAHGAKYSKSPYFIINALAILDILVLFLVSTSVFINPRILQLARTIRFLSRVALLQKGSAVGSLLAKKALDKMREDDIKFALFLLLLINLLGAHQLNESTTILSVLFELMIYLGFIFTLRHKEKSNILNIETSFMERLNKSTDTIFEQVKCLPMRIDRDTSEPELREKEVDELDYLIEGVDHIVNSLKRFTSKRTFEEAKGIKIIEVDTPIAMMFTDIEGFSTITETMKHRVIPVLQHYLLRMNRCVYQYNGDIDKFIGDAIFAFFTNINDPEDSVNKAFDATRAMLLEVKVLIDNDKEWEKIFYRKEWTEFKNIKTRYGLHFGEVIPGAVGCDSRADNTLIGDNVNIAARMESLNKHYGTYVLLTEDFYFHLSQDRKKLCRKLDRVTVAGREEPIYIYTVDFDQKSEEFLGLFSKAVEMYLCGDWQDAYEVFQKARGLSPSDNPTLTMINRIEEVKQHLLKEANRLKEFAPNTFNTRMHADLVKEIGLAPFEPPLSWTEKPWWKMRK